MWVEVLGRVKVGGLGLDAAEPRGAGPAQLLAVLALEHPRRMTRGELIDVLWPQTRPHDAAHALRQVVSRARRTVVQAGGGKDLLVSHGGRTGFAVDTLEVDLLVAERDVHAAEQLLAQGDAPAAQVRAAGAADALEPGLFPVDLPAFATWHERVVTVRARARRAAAAAAIAAGRADEAAQFAQRVLHDDPFDEHALRLLMQALADAGRTAGALAAYERARRVLADELGVRPAAATEHLHRQLLGFEPQAEPATDAAASPMAPQVALPVERYDVPVFVGRDAELARLAEQWHTVRALGVQQIAIVSGPAGIGKTRLAAELVGTVRRDPAAAVAWGRCHADGADAFEPFGQLLAQLVAARPAVVAGLGRRLDDLGFVVPDLAATAPSGEMSDDRRRERVFGVVVAAMRAAAANPVAVVIDDVQWAGPDALSLLVQVLDATVDQPVLVVLAERDATGQAAAVLGELRRRAAVTTLPLTGLSVSDVADLIARSHLPVAATSAAPVGELAAQLVGRTQGNPLFVTQYVRDAQTRAMPIDVTDLPQELATILHARVAAVPGAARAVLDLAAVSGGVVPVTLIAGCASVDYDTVLDAIDVLIAARLFESVDADHVALGHDLIRDAVLAGMSGPRRARLHEQLAEELARTGTDPERVAHHYQQAGARCAAAAAQWSNRAGASALRRGAWSAAQRAYTQANDLAADDDGRCEALVGLGRAQRALGLVAEAGDTLRQAIALARAHQLHRRGAQATLALVGGGGRGVALELADGERAALLRAALDGLETHDRALRVAVLGELALALVLTDAGAERDALCEECITTARRSADVNDLASALQTRRIGLMGPAGTRARRGDGEELLSLPAELVDPDLRIAAALGRMEDLLELGDRAGATRALHLADELVAAFPHPYWSWAVGSWSVLDALIGGRFDEAETMAHAAFMHQASSEHPEAIAALGVQLTNLRIFQGRPREMTDLLADAADANSHIPCYRAVLALCHAEAGSLDAAAAAFGPLAAAGPSFGLPVDTNWLLAVAVLGDVAATLGLADDAARLEALLQPYGDRQVVLNCYGGGGAYWGPVALVLGRLAAVQGGRERARQWQQQAVEQARSFGAPWFVERAERFGRDL